ncbi:site-2 protease family protein [Aeromicrobium sp.]|nr:site-2 protease family protein [Candidatus Saccharibacteria bacterium]
MSVILLVIGVILFIGLVVIHEFGHFIMARRNGVTVEEFGIFFPPRLYKRKTKGGWIFSINLLPLGGFVRLKGEHDSDTGKGTFGAASVWAKTKIMGAGVVMNLVVAVALFTILAIIGMPQLVPNQFTIKGDTTVTSSKVLIGYIEPNSPASKAGLKSTDRMVSITSKSACDSGSTCTEQIGLGQRISNADELVSATKKFAGQTVYVNYYHDGTFHSVRTTLRDAKTVTDSRKTDNPKGYLGVAPNEYKLQRSTWSAPIVAVGLTGQFTALTFQGLGHAVAGVGSILAGAATGNSDARQNGQTAASEQVSGPVGVFVILQDGSLIGYQFILFIIGIISLTLAIMNILPIPALDGGRLWLTIFTRGIGKPLSPKREEQINASGFLFLIGLMILITVVDVRRFF